MIKRDIDIGELRTFGAVIDTTQNKCGICGDVFWGDSHNCLYKIIKRVNELEKELEEIKAVLSHE